MNSVTIRFPEGEQIEPQSRSALFSDDLTFSFTTLLTKSTSSNQCASWQERKHLTRLNAGAKELNLPQVSLELYRKMLAAAYSSAPLSSDFYSCRIVSFKDHSTITLTSIDFPSNRTLKLLPVVCDRPSPELKSHFMCFCFEAQNLAESKGFDEALLTTADGAPLEGSWSNFYWKNNGSAIKTVKHSVLRGVVRDQLEDRLKLVEPCRENITSAFVTRSTTGIELVGKIGDRELELDKEISDLKKAFDEEVLQSFTSAQKVSFCLS